MFKRTTTNLAFFGPAHTGKSTLVGYLMTENPLLKSDDSFFEHAILAHKKRIEDMGERYEDDRIYSYFVDTNKDEIKRKDDKFSTTKEIGFSQFSINENTLILIDTPGFNKRHNEQFRGMFLADIGVFVIEAMNIHELMLLESDKKFASRYRFLVNAYFSPLFLWHQTRSIEDIVFVLSKYDVVIKNKIDLDSLLNHARSFFERLFEVDTSVERIAIVTTFIDVNKRRGHNIFESSPDVQKSSYFFDEIHLIEERKRNQKNSLICDNDSVSSLNHVSFAIVERKFGKTKRHQPAFRVKSLCNSFHIGDLITMGPVQDKNAARNTARHSFFCTGKIESIMLDGSREMSTHLEENQVGGVVLTDIKNDNGDLIYARDISVTRTAVLARAKTLLQQGNILVLKLNINVWTKHWFNYYDTYKLQLNHQLDIHWAGKTIFCILIGKRVEGHECIIQVFIPYGFLCIPRDLEILPDKDEIVLLKRYTRDKFDPAKVSENSEFDPIIFLKGKISELYYMGVNGLIKFRMHSVTADAEPIIVNYVKDVYNLDINKIGIGLYEGIVMTKFNLTRVVPQAITCLYNDNHGYFDATEIDVTYLNATT